MLVSLRVSVLHKFPAVLGGPARLLFAKEKLLAVTAAGSRLEGGGSRANVSPPVLQVRAVNPLCENMEHAACLFLSPHVGNLSQSVS